jgi:small conductance mechanosensitive channel
MQDPQQFVQFINFERVPFALFVLAVGWVILLVSSRFLDDLGERIATRRLFFKKAKALTRFVLYFAIGATVASSVLVLEQEALLAVAGTVGVAVGFAFKDLLGSLVAGVILLMDEPFQVGDRVAFGDVYGEVTEIGLRSVRVVTLDDNLVTIPNNLFLTGSVASANAGALDCMVVIPFYVGAAENYREARRIINEATATSRYVYLSKPIVTLLSDEFLGERFVTVIRVKAYVFDARYEKAFATDVTERVKEAFDRASIRMPDRQYRDLDLNQGSETPSTPAP